VQVMAINPRDTLTNAPINSRVTIAFNKPVAGQTVLNTAQSVLSTGGVAQPVFVGIVNNNQEVVLTPVNPLAGNTTYTININGIQDVAGNGMAAPIVTTFNTGTETDFRRPSVVLVGPAGKAGGVED